MRRAAILVAALFAAAARADIGAGSWDMEITSVIPGGPPGGVPVKQTQCLGAEDGRDPAKLFGNPGAGCEFIDRKDDGSTYRFRINCRGDTAVTGTGELRYSHDAIDGQIVLHMAREGQKVETRTTIRARRTGPCAATR